MKKLYTNLVLTFFTFLLVTPELTAQIPNSSTIPVDYFVEGEGGFFRSFDYTSTTLSADGETDWGTPPLSETISGELVWAIDETGTDSLCVPSPNDYTGKIALIRRGECNFSLKAWHAQETGAIGVIIVNHNDDDDGATHFNMQAGDSAALVVIPTIFMNFPNGNIILDRMNAGETLTATFSVTEFYNAIGPNKYGVPADQVLPLGEMAVSLLNVDTANALLDVPARVEIVDPNGGMTQINTTIDTLYPSSAGEALFDDYTFPDPAPIGVYQMIFTNGLNDDTLSRQFEVTEGTWQMDDGDLPTVDADSIDSWIGNSDDAFLTNNLINHVGSYYNIGPDGGMAMGMTFSLANADDLFTGYGDADAFTIVLYDADPDNDGVGPPADLTNYDPAFLLAVDSTTYVLEGTETDYQLLTVEFENPIVLKANGQYLLMIKYDGVNAGTGIPPWWTYGGTVAYPPYNTVTFEDQLHMEGWSDDPNSDFHVVARLHTMIPNGIEEVGILEEGRVNLMPNPATDYIDLRFDLEEVADEVIVKLVDLSGQTLRNERLQNVLNETYTYDVSNLPAGSYFFSILTPEGFRAKKFVVTK